MDFEGTSIAILLPRRASVRFAVLSLPSKNDLLFTVHQESLTAMRQEVETAIAGSQRALEAARRSIVALHIAVK